MLWLPNLLGPALALLGLAPLLHAMCRPGGNRESAVFCLQGVGTGGWEWMGGIIKVYLISTLSDGWRVWTRKYRNCIAWTERARADTCLQKCVDREGASRHVPPITAWTERARAHTHPPMKPAPPHTALDRGRCKGGRGGRGAPLSARAARQTNQVRHGRTAAITQRQPLLGDESHMRRLVDQLPAGFCRIYLL